MTPFRPPRVGSPDSHPSRILDRPESGNSAAGGDANVPGRLRDLLGSRIAREVYLSTEEAAQLVGSPNRRAFRKWARRHGVPLRRPDGGRLLRVKLADIEWALRVREGGAR